VCVVAGSFTGTSWIHLAAAVGHKHEEKWEKALRTQNIVSRQKVEGREIIFCKTPLKSLGFKTNAERTTTGKRSKVPT